MEANREKTQAHQYTHTPPPPGPANVKINDQRVINIQTFQSDYLFFYLRNKYCCLGKDTLLSPEPSIPLPPKHVHQQFCKVLGFFVSLLGFLFLMFKDLHSSKKKKKKSN